MIISFFKYLPKDSLIRHSWSKILKQGIFVCKSNHFCFLTKCCCYTYSRVLISTMTILLQISSPKIPKKDNFVTKFGHFHYFTLFCYQTNPRVLISNMTIEFYPTNTQKQKTPKSGTFGPKYRNFCFFTKILQFRKFEDASFKYDNSFLKFQSKKTQLRHFWQTFFLSNLGIFLFLQKFAITQIRWS